MQKLFLAFFPLFLLMACGMMIKPKDPHPSPEMSTWLWNTELIETETNEVLSFLTKKTVTKLYLQIDDDVPISSYQQFIRHASKKKIAVYALDGSSSWVDGEQSGDQESFINWMNTYQQKAQKKEQFAGIHLDVEPYLSTVWKEDYETAVHRYQTVLSDIHNNAKKLHLRFEADIPFWFDNRLYENNTYGSGTLSDWVINLADSVTIMAYRNKLDGDNGILKLTKDEINYANKQEKEVVIAIETKPLEETHLSFAGNLKGLNEAIAEIKTSYKRSDSFKGIAVHDYNYWKALDSE
jgi:hypothetical protein